MLSALRRAFTHHPASVQESYGEHFGVAMSYGVRMIGAGLCALVHAVLPFLFEKTASTMIRGMVAEMDARGRRGAAPASEPTTGQAVQA